MKNRKVSLNAGGRDEESEGVAECRKHPPRIPPYFDIQLPPHPPPNPPRTATSLKIPPLGNRLHWTISVLICFLFDKRLLKSIQHGIQSHAQPMFTTVGEPMLPISLIELRQKDRAAQKLKSHQGMRQIYTRNRCFNKYSEKRDLISNTLTNKNKVNMIV